MNKATLGVKEVERISSLARIVLPSDKLAQYSHQLDEILGYVGTVNDLAKGNDEPKNTSSKLENIWREDKVQSTEPSVDEMLANVPELEGTSIKVPAVLGDNNG